MNIHELMRLVAMEDKEFERYAEQHYREVFCNHPSGRFVLQHMAVKVFNYLGRIETEEQRLRRNAFVDILEVMGIKREVDFYEIVGKISDQPVE